MCIDVDKDNYTEFSPNYAIHPGVILEEILVSKNFSQSKIASYLGYTQKHINEIIKGKKNITPAVAFKLHLLTKIDYNFWIRLQEDYDYTVHRINLERILE